MASDGSAPYMECLLKLDPSPGWQKSATVALASFHDSVFELNSSSGYIYVKGKTQPENVLLKLKKADKHASILWSRYGPARDVQYQAQDSGGGYNHWKGHDPFSYVKGYETYHQLSHPYYSYNTDRLGATNHIQHALEYEPDVHSERSSSVHSHNHHCPVHSHRRLCPVHSNHHHTTPQDSSLPSKQSQANGQVINQPTSDKPTINLPTSDKPAIDLPTSDKPYRKGGFVNKVIGKFCSSC